MSAAFRKRHLRLAQSGASAAAPQPYQPARGIFRDGAGNAASMSRKSSSVSSTLRLRKFSSTCSAPPAFGIAITPPRIAHANMICAGVAQRRRAISASAAPRAPRNKAALRAAALHVVQHLVGGAVASVRKRQDALHVARVKIAHAPLENFSLPLQFGHGAHRLGNRKASLPVQQIEVYAIRAEPAQAARAARFVPA